MCVCTAFQWRSPSSPSFVTLCIPLCVFLSFLHTRSVSAQPISAGAALVIFFRPQLSRTLEDNTHTHAHALHLSVCLLARLFFFCGTKVLNQWTNSLLLCTTTARRTLLYVDISPSFRSLTNQEKILVHLRPKCRPGRTRSPSRSRTNSAVYS